MSAVWQRPWIRIGAWFAVCVLVFYGFFAALDADATWLDWVRLAAPIVVSAVFYQVALRGSFGACERAKTL